MVKEALKNRHTTYSEIAERVAPNVSGQTVRRRLGKKHLKKWIVQERAYLDKDIAQERLEWT